MVRSDDRGNPAIVMRGAPAEGAVPAVGEIDGLAPGPGVMMRFDMAALATVR